jgi:hypothetical protein
MDTRQRVAFVERLSRVVSPFHRLATKFFDSKFVQDPRWGVMFTFGRFRLVSNVVVFCHRSQAIRPGPDVQSLFAEIDLDTALLNMRRDGFHAGVNLDSDTVARITQFAYSTECYWPGDHRVRFLYETRADAERRCGKSILLGRYFDVEDRCDVIRAISHDPVLRFLAASYLGTVPGQTETRLWWSFVGDATFAERVKADQRFHYDLHDYRSIAFFFQLTEVDEFSGPHVHIRGSHVHKPPRRLLRRDTRQSSDEEMIRLYGAERFVTLCGPAGFGFATDPFGYHKGAPPVNRDRLMLRVRFTITDDGSRVDRSSPTSMVARTRV